MNIKSVSIEEFSKALQVRNKAYAGRNAKALYEAVCNASESVQSAIGDWIDTGKMTVLSSHGQTTEMLMAQHKMTYCAAALTVDWITNDPEKALAAINRGFL